MSKVFNENIDYTDSHCSNMIMMMWCTFQLKVKTKPCPYNTLKTTNIVTSKVAVALDRK